MCSDIDRGPPPRLSANSQALPPGTRHAWDEPVVAPPGALQLPAGAFGEGTGPR